MPFSRYPAVEEVGETGVGEEREGVQVMVVDD
jgi:hypothetical protein